MDALKAEIATKRKALESDPVPAERPNKYMKRGDLERLREQKAKEEEQRRRSQEPQHAHAKCAKVCFLIFIILLHVLIC